MTIFFPFLNSELKDITHENTRLKRELASWKEIKDDNEYLKNKVEKLKKKKEISGGGDEATKSELIEIRHELNALKSKHEKSVQELVLAKKKNVIHSSLVSKQQMREDKIKDLVKKTKDQNPDFNAEQMARKYGHDILRLPPYHCEL